MAEEGRGLPADRFGVEQVPSCGPRDGDARRRFIGLIDAAYEAGVALAAMVASPGDRLLVDAPELACLLGRDRRRGASRLAEMKRRRWRGGDDVAEMTWRR